MATLLDWLKKLPETDECIYFPGDTSTYGYGSIKIKGKTQRAHRVSYELHHGPITPGKWILHSCDNRSCVNPKHLRQGTPQENTDDCIRRGNFVPNFTPGHKIKTPRNTSRNL